MRIQVVDSQTGAPMFEPRSNATLETDLLALFDAPLPWWRPVAKRRAAHLRGEVERVCDELRQATLRS